MALLFIDGFDHYSTAQGLRKGWTFAGTAGFGLSSSNPRTGSQHISMASGSFSRYSERWLDTGLGSLVIGCAFHLTNPDLSVNNLIILYNESTAQLVVKVRESGVLEVYRSATLIGTSVTPVIYFGIYQYIEFKFTIDDSVGAIACQVDGVEVINETNIDTQHDSATINRIRLEGDTHQFTLCDDFYICDFTGSENNDFLGVVKVDTLYPDGNGNSSQFVGQDANSVDNYLNVDELLVDSDTTYNESSTVAQRDDYAYDAMNVTPVTIFGVVVNAQVKKSDAGTRSLDIFTRVAAANYDSAIDKNLTESYLNYQAIWDLNPADSLAWEVADVDGAGFGIEVAS